MTKPSKPRPPTLTRDQRRLVREIATLTSEASARPVPVDELVALDAVTSSWPSPANDNGDA